MRVEVADGFREACWPKVDGRLYASQPWLRANVARPGARPLTIRVSDMDGAAAVLGYWYDRADASEAYNLRRMVHGEPLVFPWTDSGTDRLREFTQRLQLFPSVCAVLPGYDAGVVRTTSAGPRHVRAVLATLMEAARERGAHTCAVLYVARDDETLVDALVDAGFVAIALTSRAVLPVCWDDLDSYVAHFPPRRRHRVRGELNRLARLHVTSTYVDPAREAATVVRLRCAHLRSFGRQPDENGERRRLAALLDQFAGEDLRLVLTLRDGSPVSCSLLLRADTTVTVLLGATDPAGEARLTHFESSFYAPIRLGVPRRGDVIDYGISHLDHKVLRGCRPQPLDGWIRSDDPATMATLRAISELSSTASLEAPGVPRPRSASMLALGPTGPTRQLDIVVKAGIDFITGVPDSELAGLLAELDAVAPPSDAAAGRAARLDDNLIYVRATREDNAVALAAGACLAGRTPLVFMKSMGVGTAVDALTSLAQVYELPLILYVSWAGFQGVDVPHHNALGAVLSAVLRSLRVAQVRHVIGRLDELAAGIGRAVEMARARRRPVALLGIPPSLARAGRDAA